MVAITNTTSLAFLNEGIHELLDASEMAIAAFLDDGAEVSTISDCVTHFEQIAGVAKMLEMPAAVMMSQHMAEAAQRLQKHQSVGLASALSSAVILLGRYFDYVELKNNASPVLLVNGINQLLRALGKPVIEESYFYRVSLQPARPNMPEASELDDDAFAELARRLRHMFQVGLLGLLNQSPSAAHYKLMERALQRLDDGCGPCSASKLLWVSRAAIIALQDDGMRLTPARYVFLSQLERIIKAAAKQGRDGLASAGSDALLRNGLFLVSLSQSTDSTVLAVQKTFMLPATVPDRVLQQEQRLMEAAKNEVVNTVIAVLREEINGLKDSLDYSVSAVGDSDFSELASNLERLAGSLTMVNQDLVADRLRQRAAAVARWAAANPADSPEFQLLVDDLLATENVLATLQHNLGPKSDLRGAVSNRDISLYQLDDARLAVVTECRSGLVLARRSLTSFMDHQWDAMHLTNLPNTFKSVAGGLTFLGLHRAGAIIEASLVYLKTVLLGGKVPSIENMETLADALAGVDYYLESMSEQKPIGAAVLEVAEGSMAALGYPVKTLDTQAS